MWALILNSLYFVASLAGLHGSQPCVRLGGTTFIGKRLETPNLEFFGGPVILSHYPRSSILLSSLSGIPFAEPPIDGLRFSPPKLKHFSTPLRSFDASKYGKSCIQPVSNLSSSLSILKPILLRTAAGCRNVGGLSHT
jgi:hypothetical protein